MIVAGGPRSTGSRAAYDAVIVGARCAGSPLAARLATSGWRVLLLDHKPPPANTISTHFVFPNTIARLAELGVLERIERRHRLNWCLHRVQVLGHEIAGAFTPVAGYDRCLGLRRPVLDQALLDAAVDAGAETRFGGKVAGLSGSGRDGDPVTGVVLEGGERIEARWVIGADGRASTVARALGLEKRKPLAGEFGILYSYWRGLPETEYLHIVANEDLAFNWGPCEDDVQILIVNGDAESTKGSAGERERRFLDGLTRFPGTFPAESVAGAERISPILVAPETMLRGFYRRAAGPGWALVGDAGHFKHPATAQGISDAIEQAIRLADALDGGDGSLEGFERWRDERAGDHYEWSFQFAIFPRPDTAGPIFAGLAADAEAGQDFRDAFARRTSPRADVFTRDRLSRWFAAAAAPA